LTADVLKVKVQGEIIHDLKSTYNDLKSKVTTAPPSRSVMDVSSKVASIVPSVPRSVMEL